MAETRARGLGLGLSALLGDAGTGADERLLEIPLDQLRPNARQPRAHFDESELAELVASITQDGVLQPVLVRPLSDGPGIRADRGRAPLARRARGRAGHGSRDRPRGGRSRGPRARRRRERRAHRPRPDRGGARVRAPVRRDGTDPGGGRAGGGPQPRRGHERPAPARPSRRRDRAARAPRAERGPRARAAARPDHEDRRRLAREAIRKSWSVRALETAARAAAGRESAAPSRRRTGTPSWLDPAAADDLVDAAYAALGVPARLAVEGESVRLELRVRDAGELARLRNALEAAGMLRPRPGD